MDTHETSHIPPVSLLTDTVAVNRAAELAGVSRRTIYSWISRGLVETKFSPSGAVRVVASSLVRDERPVVNGRAANLRRKVA